MVYAAADGQPIINQGERVIRGTSTNGNMISIPFNVAEVHKALSSVSHMVDRGHRVVLDSAPDHTGFCAYALHKSTKKCTPFYKRNGVYNFKVCVDSASSHRAMDKQRQATPAAGFGRPR